MVETADTVVSTAATVVETDIVVPTAGRCDLPARIYLRAGQTMRLGIEGLGEQRQQTVQA